MVDRGRDISRKGNRLMINESEIWRTLKKVSFGWFVQNTNVFSWVHKLPQD